MSGRSEGPRPGAPVIPPGAVVVVYDGECGFCRRSVDEIRRRDRDRRMVYLPRSTPGIEEKLPALAEGDFDTGIRVFDPDGTIHVGADGIRHIASQLPIWRRLAWAYDLPIIRPLARRAYAWVAANRMRISRACGPDGACRLSGSAAEARDGSHPVISVFILVILALQAGTFAYGSRFWPFMIYSMYRDSEKPRPIFQWKRRVIARTTSGERLELLGTPEMRLFAIFEGKPESRVDPVGLNSFAMRKLYLNPLLDGDTGAARRLAERINATRPADPVVAIEVESRKYAAAPDGVVEGERKLETFPIVP